MESESQSESQSKSGDEPMVKTPRRKKAWVTKRNNRTDEEVEPVEEVDDITPAAPPRRLVMTRRQIQLMKMR